MWRSILAGLAACVLAEEDGSCMLQARHGESSHKTHRRVVEEEFCAGPVGELNFDSFEHGDEIFPDSIKGVIITGERRATEPQEGQAECPGPLRVLNTRAKQFPSIDKDLQRCGNCTMIVWAKDNLVNLKRPKVNDCGEHPGAKITFTFKRLMNLVDIELWDLEEPTYLELNGKHGKLLANISAPDGPDQDGNPAKIPLMVKGVRNLTVYLGGSGAVRKIRACKPQGSVVGDPHIYTLDGDKFDFYQNGTFSVFHYSGQKLPNLSEKNATVDWQLYSHYGGPFWTAQSVLLVDRSMGSMRQALEMTSKDCQWYKKSGATWYPVHGRSLLSFTENHRGLTMFEHVHEKKIVLRMRTETGAWKDTLVLNTVCKPSGINMRISMPDLAESRFLEGQIEVGNGETQKKYIRKSNWTALGGSGPANSFIQKLESTPVLSLLNSCGEAERARSEQICLKHLGAQMRDAMDEDGDIFNDCVGDVCRGGEEFAIAAKELLTAYRD